MTDITVSAASRLGMVGCGNIAERYADAIAHRDDLILHGFFDVAVERATALASVHGGVVYPTLDALLSDPDVDIVVNLTIFDVHYEVVKAGLLAGKHVYSEKPLALASADAAELVSIAASGDLGLACAPFTFLGAAQQEVGRLVHSGKIGVVRVVYAEVNHGRIETWHPSPAPFYAVGPLIDVGVYPLTVVTAILGPVARVNAFAAILAPERRTATGVRFVVESPDFWVVNLDLDSGVVVRLTANFYVPESSHQGETMAFHGDAGSIMLGSWHHPGATVELWSPEGEVTTVALPEGTAYDIDWSAGLAEFAASTRHGSRSRLRAEHAAHVVEVLEAAQVSATDGRTVEVVSRFEPPPID